MDSRTPRDGRALEELGTYDPLIPETDARVSMQRDRVDYWLGVGAQPTEKVAVLIKKYGTDGTHLDAQKLAQEKLAQPVAMPDPGKPASMPKSKEEPKEEATAAETKEPAADKTSEAKEKPVEEKAEAPVEKEEKAEAPADDSKKE